MRNEKTPEEQWQRHLDNWKWFVGFLVLLNFCLIKIKSSYLSLAVGEPKYLL